MEKKFHHCSLRKQAFFSYGISNLRGKKIALDLSASSFRAGPIVWFQKFEYAIGHWLQKSTEHTIGCVLCSPGCFSLFRAKALMYVMAKYATKSTEARHYIQYDQGEDRWLCTLLLQMGFRVSRFK